jgi:hypothetical protein
VARAPTADLTGQGTPWVDSLIARPDKTPTAPRQSTAVNRQLLTDPTDPDSNINGKPDSQPVYTRCQVLSSCQATARQPDSSTARQQPDTNPTATLEMTSTSVLIYSMVLKHDVVGGNWVPLPSETLLLTRDDQTLKTALFH